MQYPDDWPCKCRHTKSQHGERVITYPNSCLVKGGIITGEGWADNCDNFNPIDNLTFIERQANARKISS